MEMNKLSKFAATAIIAAALTACSSSDTIDDTDTPAAVDTRTDETGAQSHGTGVDAPLEGSDVTDIDKASLTTTYYFAFDSNSLTAEPRAELDKVAAFMLPFVGGFVTTN